jgi:hypothetical protein
MTHPMTTLLKVTAIVSICCLFPATKGKTCDASVPVRCNAVAVMSMPVAEEADVPALTPTPIIL